MQQVLRKEITNKSIDCDIFKWHKGVSANIRNRLSINFSIFFLFFENLQKKRIDFNRKRNGKHRPLSHSDNLLWTTGGNTFETSKWQNANLAELK